MTQARALVDALGYDMDTVEFAVRDGVLYAIDFLIPAPDFVTFSIKDQTDYYRQALLMAMQFRPILLSVRQSRWVATAPAIWDHPPIHGRRRDWRQWPRLDPPE